MSGPKVDIASIRAQEMAKLAAARDGRRNISDKIQNLIKQVNDSLDLDLDLMMKDENLSSSCKRIVERQEECTKDLKKILGIIKAGNEMLNIEELNVKAHQIVQDYQQSIKNEIATVSTLAKSSEQYKKLEENRQQLEQAKRKQIVFLSQAENDVETTESDINEITVTFQDEIREFMQGTSMSGKRKNTILALNQDIVEVINSEISVDRKQKRLKRYYEEFKNMTELIRNEEAEMKIVYDEYLRESFDLNIPIREFEEFSSRKEIDEAILDAKEQANEQVSKEYIKRQIDDVMSRHGYDVVKSDMLSESENGQVLYGVDDETAINVFVSNENQVTMRVVGIGFDSDISEKEDEQLFQQQCAFCSMHPKITAELAMRGVILETKKHMPPDKRFNKKIQTKVKNETDSTKQQKKRKRTDLKTMYKE